MESIAEQDLDQYLPNQEKIQIQANGNLQPECRRESRNYNQIQANGNLQPECRRESRNYNQWYIRPGSVNAWTSASYWESSPSGQIVTSPDMLHHRAPERQIQSSIPNQFNSIISPETSIYASLEQTTKTTNSFPEHLQKSVSSLLRSSAVNYTKNMEIMNNMYQDEHRNVQLKMDHHANQQQLNHQFHDLKFDTNFATNKISNSCGAVVGNTPHTYLPSPIQPFLGPYYQPVVSPKVEFPVRSNYDYSGVTGSCPITSAVLSQSQSWKTYT